MRACDPRPSQDGLDLELNGAEQLGEGMYSASPKDTLHAVSPPSSHTHTRHTDWLTQVRQRLSLSRALGVSPEGGLRIRSGLCL